MFKNRTFISPMKTRLIRPQIGRLICSVIFVLLTVAAFAQNASDSDLSNKADTNKNWSGAGWFIGVAVILILVVFFTLRKRRN